MSGMDLSDVGYDAFLINGKKESQLLMAHPGEKVRLRIINAAASSYFFVSLGQSAMKVISADGIDIDPIYAKELFIGMAETYDILFTVPEAKNYELRATAQDVTGYASGWIGMGPKVRATEKMQPDLYAPMNHESHSELSAMSHADHKSPTTESTVISHAEMGHGDMDHSGHDMSAGAEVEADNLHISHDVAKTNMADEQEKETIETLTVDHLKAQSHTVLPKNANVADLELVLGGDMERYVWHINGKAIHEDRDILINEGDVVRFTFVNKTMMHHPMHLHGHFFRVLNAHKEKSPLKHTVDVPPMGTKTIEFYANEPGQWMLHCHNLYHMKTGMARVVKYMTFKSSAEVAKHEMHDPHLHDHIYKSGSIQAATNHAEGRFKLSQTWNEINAKIESRKDDDWDTEGDLFYRRWFSNYFNVALGVSAVHDDYRGVAGIGYTLPLLIEANILVDHKGMLRVDLAKRFQWTSTLFTEAEYIYRQDKKFDSDFAISLMYGKNWNWAVGLKATDRSLGAGLQYQF